jgi:autotransporter-associated beta strand protein
MDVSDQYCPQYVLHVIVLSRLRLLMFVALVGGFFQPLEAQDITSEIVANADVTLVGSATITLAGDQTLAYTATNGITGDGTITIVGTGTLVLEQSDTIALPAVGESLSGFYQSTGSFYTYQGYTSSGFIGWLYSAIASPDPPAIIISSGATLQWGIQTSANTIVSGDIQNLDSSYPSVNLDNILDNGLLNIDSNVDPGIISGIGSVMISAASNNTITQIVVNMNGLNTFTGALIIENDQTLHLGTDHIAGSAPYASTIFNNGTLILDSPYTESTSISQNIYENHYGNDININGNGGLITLGGVYSYSNAGNGSGQFTPSLTVTAENYGFINGNASGRGLNIYGVLQLGNGSTTNYFLPGNPDNTYINLYGAILSFDYASTGPTYMNNIISGGQITFDNLFGDPGSGVVIVDQGHVVVTQQQFYNGITQINSGAILQLGDGTHGDKVGTITAGNFYETSGGDGDIMQAGQTVSIATDNPGEGTGTSTGIASSTAANGATQPNGDELINNGTLIVDNLNATEFLNIMGTGQLIQAGTGTTTLYSNTTYTGKTTITGGTLAIGSGGSIASSSEVDLEVSQSALVSGPQDTSSAVITSDRADFDISQAGNQTILDLSGSNGTTVWLGSNTLTLGTLNSTTYAGTITDGGIGGGTEGGIVLTTS